MKQWTLLAKDIPTMGRRLKEGVYEFVKVIGSERKNSFAVLTAIVSLEEFSQAEKLSAMSLAGELENLLDEDRMAYVLFETYFQTGEFAILDDASYEEALNFYHQYTANVFHHFLCRIVMNIYDHMKIETPVEEFYEGGIL